MVGIRRDGQEGAVGQSGVVSMYGGDGFMNGAEGCTNCQANSQERTAEWTAQRASESESGWA